MTKPFPEILHPEVPSPVVVSVPHAGIVVPEEERAFYAVDIDALLLDGDLYTDELYADAAAVGATIIRSPYSRFVIDLNRLPGDLDPRSVQGASRINKPGHYGIRGLIWGINTRGERIYRKPLSREVLQRRIDKYYAPYHAALARTLAAKRDEFGFAVLLDAHSMPSRATRFHSDTGSDRSDVVPGDLKGKSCAPWLRHFVATFWRNAGHTVTLNSPYQGGGITRSHAAPDEGIHAIQVELNRALYMNERTLDRAPGLRDLTTQCTSFVSSLVEEANRQLELRREASDDAAESAKS